MTRPDEIAALADRLKDHSEAARAAAKCSMPFGKMRRGWNALADDIDEALSRLSATSPAVRALEPWRDELEEITSHLGAAIMQSTDKDDKIIMDHVKAAHEIAKIVRRKA